MVANLTKTSEPDYDENQNDKETVLEWDDVKVTGSCDTSELSGEIQEGDQITNCSGIINIIHIATNTLLGAWDFT